MIRMIAFVFAVLALMPAAQAQPYGPYQRDCSEISVDRTRFAGKDRDYLYAVCRTRSGREIGSVLYHFQRCRGLIESVDGVLRCDGLPAVPLPRGPYLQSCENIIIANGVPGSETLYARCRTASGRVAAQSQLALAACDGASVFNNNGSLACSYAQGPDPYAPPPGPGYGPGYGPTPPRGSYRATCDQIYVTPGRGRTLTLNARCQTRRGRMVDTFLPDYQSCRGDIGNNDGRLECVGAQGENLGQSPRGSYRSTCRDEELVRGPGGTVDLIATCRTRSGRFVDATLPNVRACSGDIGNDNGRLVCQTRPSLGEPPAGSYRSTCRDIRLEQGAGRMVDLLATCQTRSGRFVDASLPNVRGCKGDIGNNDGQLVCAR